ncbi:DUF1840 domain-containing protein [Marinomonas piezotolerans]|uniref:DUF1840 domain-containing protein n=1 Tax=Marinomonas piezotolerans TaxID=2213058 RepID=A0A370U6Y0_9GAMM|nr:DUF1840 domain-containing protein [Marinomonas piezotolerans]RDL43530.1 DUF1840 domain-containing protein [Marinomonas piezotolerans]
MLITFRSNAYANITMFGSVGLQMISMMGYGSQTSGAIKAEDIPQALEKLMSALAAEKVNGTPVDADLDENEQDTPPISLANRAVPLIDMLKAANQEDSHIMWDNT